MVDVKMIACLLNIHMFDKRIKQVLILLSCPEGVKVIVQRHLVYNNFSVQLGYNGGRLQVLELPFHGLYGVMQLVLGGVQYLKRKMIVLFNLFPSNIKLYYFLRILYFDHIDQFVVFHQQLQTTLLWFLRNAQVNLIQQVLIHIVNVEVNIFIVLLLKICFDGFNLMVEVVGSFGFVFVYLEWHSWKQFYLGPSLLEELFGILIPCPSPMSSWIVISESSYPIIVNPFLIVLKEHSICKLYPFWISGAVQVYKCMQSEQDYFYMQHVCQYYIVCKVQQMQVSFKQFLSTHLQLQLFQQRNAPNPTIEEISKIVTLINQLYPNTNLALIASHLYHTMKESTSKVVSALTYYSVINTNDQLNQTKPSLQKHTHVNDVLQNSLKIKESHYDKCNGALLRKCEIRNIISILKKPQDEQKYKLKQVAIEAFVTRGYGMSQFREYAVTVNFTSKVAYKKYAACITSLVAEALKTIQKFIQTSCGLLVEQLSKPDMRILHSILLNLGELVSKQAEGQHLFNIYTIFLRSIYNLLPRPQQISVLNVYKTYQAIMRLLAIRQQQVGPLRSDVKEKISVFKQDSQKVFIRKQSNPQSQLSGPNRKSPIVKKWGSQSQNQLAAFFMELQDFGRVRDRYRQIYGSITMFENMITLRSYLYKIIRKSLRRAQKLSRVYSERLSEETIGMINLRNNETYVQYVLTSPEFNQSRVLLCKLHNMQEKDFNLLGEIGQSIAEGLHARANTRRNIMNKM